MSEEEFYSRALSFDEVGKQVDIFEKEKINYEKEIERLNKDLETSIEICNNRQKEIVRLNNIIEKYKKHLKEYDKWLDYNTEIGNLYWYDATPFPKLELKGSDKE